MHRLAYRRMTETILHLGERKSSGLAEPHSSLGPGLQAAADYVVASQCAVGGWCWPNGMACCPNPPVNTAPPIALGLLNAYAHTSDPDHLAAAELAADWVMAYQYTNGEARFGSFTAMHLYRLSGVTGDSTYSDWAATEFYDELTAATYGPDDLDTYGWIAAVQAYVPGSGSTCSPGNSCTTPTWPASSETPAALRADTVSQQDAFVGAILAGLNTLDSTTSTYVDYLGVAGGVYGLALNGTTTFPAIVSPNSALVNGIDSLCDLADVLAMPNKTPTVPGTGTPTFPGLGVPPTKTPR